MHFFKLIRIVITWKNLEEKSLHKIFSHNDYNEIENRSIEHKI